MGCGLFIDGGRSHRRAGVSLKTTSARPLSCAWFTTGLASGGRRAARKIDSVAVYDKQ